MLFTLGSLRYRTVTVDHGGPVEKIDESSFDFRGRRWRQANAYLSPEIAWWRASATAADHLYNTCEGTGTHLHPVIARHIAISEALERWAFHDTATAPVASLYGFDRDPSSNGMATYPGIRRSQARRKAQMEAVERFGVLAWWEGRLPGRVIDTDWPGVRAVLIENPSGAVACIAFSRTPEGAYCYGHAAEESIGAACEKAILEMTRHELVVRNWRGAQGRGGRQPATLIERRALFFSTEAGHELFLERVNARCRQPIARPEVLVDKEIPGPWSRYATVWRFVFQPLTDRFWTEGDEYFYW